MSLRASDGALIKSALAKYYSQGECSVNIRATTQANSRKRRAEILRTERLVQARTGQRPPQYYNIRDSMLSSSFVMTHNSRNNQMQTFTYVLVINSTLTNITHLPFSQFTIAIKTTLCSMTY